MIKSPLLVSISGAQCTGKSTVIEEIKKLQSQSSKIYHIDYFKAARTIMADMGVSVDDLEVDTQLAIRFQTKLFRAKALQDFEVKLLNNDIDIVIVERSLADLYTYAELWLSKKNEPGNNVWLHSYKSFATEFGRMTDMSFILPVGVFDHQDDGIRAKQNSQKQYAKQLLVNQRHIHGPDRVIELSKDLVTPEQRALKIMSTIEDKLK